ncbi:pentapeptide repeat-containing protein [Planotetraspora silvatica]|nr:pentapeptide repeat-containing protein [Planotetraspora silvatica]
MRVRGARINNGLDLAGGDVGIPIFFEDCVFDTAPCFDKARMTSISFDNCTLPGLSANGVAVEGDVELRACQINGQVDLVSARIGADLVLAHTRIMPHDRIGIDADGVTVGGNVSARGMRCEGSWYLNSAAVGGVFLDEAQIVGENAIVQAAQMIIGNGGFYARDGFRAEGMVNLFGSTVAGPIAFRNATLSRPGKRAFVGMALRLNGDLYAGEGLVVEGSIDMRGAEISGVFDLAGATLTCPAPEGSVRLSRAAVHGGVTAGQAHLAGLLDLSMSQVTGGVVLTETVVSGAEESPGSVALAGASISGDLDMRKANLSGLLDVSSAVLQGNVDLADATLGEQDGVSLRAGGLVARRFTFSPVRPPGRIELGHAAVEIFDDDRASWPTETGRVELDQFSYRSLAGNMAVEERITWLARGTPNTEPGPYNQLADCYRATGRERDASRVLREKLRRVARARGRLWRLWGFIQDLTLGYGYQPWRAIIGVIGLLALGTIYFSTVACGTGAARTDGLCPIKADEHPDWDPFIYSLDLLIPLVSLGHDATWNPTGLAKMITMVLIVSGWVLVTTVAAAAARAFNRS